MPCEDARLKGDDLSSCWLAAVAAHTDSAILERGFAYGLNRPPPPEDRIDVVDGESNNSSMCSVLWHTEGSETDGDRVTSEVVLHGQNCRKRLH